MSEEEKQGKCPDGEPHYWVYDREYKPPRMSHKHIIYKCKRANCGAEKESACVRCDQLDAEVTNRNARFRVHDRKKWKAE